MFKILFILGVAVAVPVFFVLTWLTSSYHRLATLRDHCETIRKRQVNAQGAPNDLPDGERDYGEALAKYNQCRQAFPTSIISAIFGFRPDEGHKSKD